MITIILLFLSVLPLIYFLIPDKNAKRIASYVDKLPGPKKYPLIGTSAAAIGLSREDIHDFFDIRNKRHGPLWRAWLGRTPNVHITKAKHVEKLLNSTVNIYKADFYEITKAWLGEGLISGNGPSWFRHRKLITPSFHFKILDHFVEVFNEKAQKYVKTVAHKADGKTEFNMYTYITHSALEIICETAMGVKIDLESETCKQYVEGLMDVNELILKRMLQPWLASDFLYGLTKEGKKMKKLVKILHDFTMKAIKEKRELYEKEDIDTKTEDSVGSKRRLAFLDTLLTASEDGKGLTDVEIRDEVDTFMFAGHDTTTAAMCWSILLLGNHPEIQEKVREEVKSIFTGDTLSMKDLNDLKLLDMVIKEALRLFPSVPTIGRKLIEDIEIDGYTIPSGATVTMHITDIHRDPDQFENPDEFNPDRFLPENSKNRYAYAFIPFSAGARNCIGQKFAQLEEKVILAYTLKNYRIKSLDDYKTIKKYKELVLRPQTGLRVILEPL